MRDRHSFFAVWLALLAGICANAQTTGALEGTARDPAGLTVPDCRVEILDPANGAIRIVSTGPDGVYFASGIPPGTYQIKVSHAGFRTMSLDHVEARAGYTVRGDFRLQLGEVREIITVTEQPSLVSTAATDWGGSIRRSQLEALPLKNRDTFDLVAQQPGASIPTNTNKSLVAGLGGVFSVNGSRPWQNSYRLDGVFINEASGGAPSSASGRLLGIESLEEVQLVTSPFSAEFGRTTGGAFTAVSRSGSNDLHGTAYEFLRNDAFDAKNFFDAADGRIPPLRKNQFGGLLSGPILPNRLFLLGNYEGVRQVSGLTVKQATLSEAARRGILTPGASPVTIDPAVVPFLDVYPLPNGRDLGNGAAEYVNTIASDSREDFATAKADWIPGARIRSSLRYSFDRGSVTSPDYFNLWRFDNDSRYHILHSETTFLSSPETILNFRLGFSRVWNANEPVAVSQAARTLSFLPGRTLGAIKTVGLDNIGDAAGGSVGTLPRRNVLEDFQFNHDASFVRGAHVRRYGAGYDRIHLNQRADVSYYGLYRFDSIANLLAGHARTGDLMYPGSDSVRGFRQNLFFGFVQDEWRATRRLSVTLGVRYETYSTPTEVNGKIATLPDPLRDAKTTVGGPLFENPSHLNFAPRAAVAWDVTGTGRTVIRAGAGIFYDLIGSRDLQVAGMRMPPFFLRVAPRNPSFPDLLGSALSTTPAVAPDTLDYHLNQPYVAQFQLRIEKQLGADTVVQIGYAGSRGVHLMGFVTNINTTAPVTMPDGRLFFPANSPRLNPAFQQIAMRRSQFDSNYHALNLFLQRHLRKGLQFQAKYTWSKSIDNNSVTMFNDFTSAGGFPMVYDYRANRGPSDFDRRHDFAASIVWQVPGPRSGMAWGAFGGWSIDAMAQAQSGSPFGPTVGFDRARLQPSSSDQGQRPNAVGVPASQVILGDVNHWFDANAFTLPEAGFLGNLGRNTLIGPGLFTLDMAVRKNVWHTDRQTVSLRAESYNLTNHPNFAIPSGDNLSLFDSQGQRLQTAGRITNTASTSRQIQLSLRWSF